MTDPEILSRPRFDIRLIKDAEERAEHLRRDVKVAVTCSPAEGIESTLRFSERLMQRGFRVAARRVHLEEMSRWFDEHGLRKIYVIGGDAREPGRYSPDEQYDIAGLHLYTFSQVESTAQWRRRMLGPEKAGGAGVPR
jgi:hypothetical protein